MWRHIHRGFPNIPQELTMTLTVYSRGLRKVQQAQFPQRDIHHSGPETLGPIQSQKVQDTWWEERAGSLHASPVGTLP